MACAIQEGVVGLNVWGFKRKAKLSLELERYYLQLESTVKNQAVKLNAKKKADQFRCIKEFCLKMVKRLSEAKIKIKVKK